MPDLEAEILDREWFYRFDLPSGRQTRTRVAPDVLQIHETRLQMMLQTLEACFGDGLAAATAIDAASHEGYFAAELARRCASVRGIEVNPQSIAAANLIRRLYGLDNLEFVQADLEEIDAAALAPADLVLAFGLVYHLENPVRVLRKLRALTRRLLLIETQTMMLDLTGPIDWGHHLWQTELHGIFGIVSEAAGASEGGTSTLSLVPSRDGLIWILRQLGFGRVDIVPPPPDGYPQLVSGRRVMLAAYP